jgi:hypothetical protein
MTIESILNPDDLQSNYGGNLGGGLSLLKPGWNQLVIKVVPEDGERIFAASSVAPT